MSFETFKSPVLKCKPDPISFATPVLKPRVNSDDDDITTAAPSPWSSAPLDSPCWSPAPGFMPDHRGSFPLPKAAPDNETFMTPPWAPIEHGFLALPLQKVLEASDATASPLEIMTPPCTPRKASTPAFAQKKEPCTPQKAPYCPFPTTVPALPQKPCLMQALCGNTVERVQEVLNEEPDAPGFPFFDHEMEPPLCFALKAQCCPEIIRLLLEHGADPKMKDRKNRTPADLLRSLDGPAREHYIDIETIERILGVEPDLDADAGHVPIIQDFDFSVMLKEPSWANCDVRLPPELRSQLDEIFPF